MIAKSQQSKKWHHVLAGGEATWRLEMYCGRFFYRSSATMIDDSTNSFPMKMCKTCVQLKDLYKRR